MLSRILEFFSDMKNHDVKYLQIGAFDGSTGDLIYPFISSKKWKGVRVEPIPYYFNKLKDLHANDNNTVCVNKAISNDNGSTKIYSVKDAEDNPPFSNQLSSFKREIILKHADKIPDLEKKIFEQQIESVTFKSLIETYNLKDVNLIYIDTEGFDFEILQQIDFSEIKPDMIIFENKHLKSDDLKTILYSSHELMFLIYRIGQDTLLLQQSVLENLLTKNSELLSFQKQVIDAKFPVKFYLKMMLKKLIKI